MERGKGEKYAAGRVRGMGPLAVDFFTVADFDGEDNQFFVADRINNPIGALPNTMQIFFAGVSSHLADAGSVEAT